LSAAESPSLVFYTIRFDHLLRGESPVYTDRMLPYMIMPGLIGVRGASVWRPNRAVCGRKKGKEILQKSGKEIHCVPLMKGAVLLTTRDGEFCMI